MTTNELPPFQTWPSIARLMRECVVTEKIDGTNAQVCVLEDGRVLAGSRNKWITPEQDNMGFARWVAEHEAALREGLGFGTHYGEWWGAGIQRRYGLKEKRFSLFNVGRWKDGRHDHPDIAGCCYTVPVLYRGTFDTMQIMLAAEQLRQTGSIAAPGFMNPEGVVVFHEKAGSLFKFTLDGDAAKSANVPQAA